MKISLSPQLRAAPFAMSVTGDVLEIDGLAYDFTPLGEGDVLPREAVNCPWLVSDVARDGGQVTLTLILPHGPNAPAATLFPAPITVAEDGPVSLPPFDITPEIEEQDA